mmetsp:Transcript_24180/g.32139  ORF Transcript_24180/g.32139 Transcript_24180/m.32139 type:complete len:440 (-) Transcript_24180:69-1388(-)
MPQSIASRSLRKIFKVIFRRKQKANRGSLEEDIELDDDALLEQYEFVIREYTQEEVCMGLADMDFFHLLNMNPRREEDRGKLNGDAIIKLVQQNPSLADAKYEFVYGKYDFPWNSDCRKFRFPLHQALLMQAPDNVIDALSSPHALEEKNADTLAFHLACRYDASMNVIRCLSEQQPDAIRKKGAEGELPLHISCNHYKPRLDLVKYLLKGFPDAIKEKDDNLRTPLHHALSSYAPFNVISLLLKKWHGALKEQDKFGNFPLHMICHCMSPSVKTVSLILKSYPAAIKGVESQGNTPLQVACEKGPLDVVLLLLDFWLRKKENRNRSSLQTLEESTEKRYSKDVKKLIAYVSSFYKRDDEIANKTKYSKEIMTFCLDKKWWFGVKLMIDRYPNVAPRVLKSTGVKTYAMPNFLFMIGKRCRLTTMWEVIRNEQDLLEGV